MLHCFPELHVLFMIPNFLTTVVGTLDMFEMEPENHDIQNYRNKISLQVHFHHFHVYTSSLLTSLFYWAWADYPCKPLSSWMPFPSQDLSSMFRRFGARVFGTAWGSSWHRNYLEGSASKKTCDSQFVLSQAKIDEVLLYAEIFSVSDDAISNTSSGPAPIMHVFFYRNVYIRLPFMTYVGTQEDAWTSFKLQWYIHVHKQLWNWIFMWWFAKDLVEQLLPPRKFNIAPENWWLED